MANANRQPQPISPRQIKIIHTIKTKLGIDDAAYRTLLRGYAVMTSKDLTWREAEELIGELNQKSDVRRETVDVNPPDKTRYTEMDGRPGYASGAQCRMIAGMWAGVSRATDDEGRERALFSFLRRICGVDHFRFLKSYQVQKVIKAIQIMREMRCKM